MGWGVLTEYIVNPSFNWDQGQDQNQAVTIAYSFFHVKGTISISNENLTISLRQDDDEEE